MLFGIHLKSDELIRRSLLSAKRGKPKPPLFSSSPSLVIEARDDRWTGVLVVRCRYNLLKKDLLIGMPIDRGKKGVQERRQDGKSHLSMVS